MYMRSYKESTDNGILIPENYDGNAFRHSYITEESKEAPTKEEPCEEVSVDAGAKRSSLSSVFSLFKDGNLGRLFLGGEGLKLGSIRFGNEEILIIGIAILLFFSKGKDPECGILLLMLLLIN